MSWTNEEKKAYSKAYYQTHKEKMQAKHKTWYEANRESEKAKHKAWREANKDKMKAWHEANRESEKVKCKAWYEANKDKVKAWREDHKKERKEYKKAYMKAYYKSDINALGQTKHSIRQKSQYYLNKYGKKIPDYEIHHCFGYEDPSKFIYCSKELHVKIHKFLRDNNIDADSDHYEQIKHLLDEKVITFGL